MSTTILHADLDAFYASVEQRDAPELRRKPVIVGGGVVLAASYEAKARGIKTAMGEATAKRLCPDAVVVPPRMQAYADASKAVFEIFYDTTPMVEGLSIDEAFLDVTGLWRLVGDGASIATTLRKRVLDEVGLVISVGVASTKFLAKVASAVSKPDGLLVVEPGRELEFLHPLPVQRLWGVGPKTADKLRDHGITHVHQVAASDLDQLVSWLGKASGRHIHSLAHNHDQRRVETGKRRRSIGSQRSFPGGGRSQTDVDGLLLDVVDRVAGRLRGSNQTARTVVLRLRTAEFTPKTRSRTLPHPTADTAPILATARELLAGYRLELREAGQARAGLTRVGISVTGLGPDSAVQLPLPFDFNGPSAAVTPNRDGAVDAVRLRFGGGSIRRAGSGSSGFDTGPILGDPVGKRRELAHDR